ncbi:MAG: tRNA (guanosine(37)-N1)-methyltransferase TrmD [Eubacterium sp.]|nr:tRNA (guanosine(37)-N1)-methyltransferase TrmD [Eubacterium sp.]
MKFNILTLFPEMFTPIKASMTGRAEKKGLLDFNIVNIRDFSRDKHKKTDDTPFGGGHGMVMMTDPIFRALKSVGAVPADGADDAHDTEAPADGEGAAKADTEAPAEGTDAHDTEAPAEGSTDRPSKEPVSNARKRIIYMSPRGKILDRAKIEELSREEELIILCGHYEGVDQRVIDHFGIEEISIGDYILTGGELAAMVLIDSVSRLIPGVLAKDEAVMDESVYSGLLEYPQYTQPREYEGLEVPEILLNGNHELIDEWKFEKSLLLTKERRPDLFEKYVAEHRGAESGLSKRFRKIIEKVADDESKK